MCVVGFVLGVVGGTPVTGDPEVFALKALCSNNQTGRCTAVLIGRRTLLTAAHCVDPAVAGATAVQVIAANMSDATGVFPVEQKHTIVTVRMHPDWNEATHVGDLALVAVDPPVHGIPTKSVDTTHPAPSGMTVRFVGYGVTAEGADDAGIKRETDTVITKQQSNYFWLGGPCTGDSGGPVMHTFGDGIERIVGVDSFSELGSNCQNGGATRLDIYAAFITSALAELDAAQCTADDACAPGCNDPDCLPDAPSGGLSGVSGPSSMILPPVQQDHDPVSPAPVQPEYAPKSGCAAVSTWPLVILAVLAARRRLRNPWVA